MTGDVSDKPRRVLLKLSGEAFGGGAVGIDTSVVRRIAEEIVPAVQQGVQVAIVVGGGNFFRGAQLASDDNMLPDSQKGFAPVDPVLAQKLLDAYKEED